MCEVSGLRDSFSGPVANCECRGATTTARGGALLDPDPEYADAPAERVLRDIRTGLSDEDPPGAVRIADSHHHARGGPSAAGPPENQDRLSVVGEKVEASNRKEGALSCPVARTTSTTLLSCWTPARPCPI
ncbi:hypothetical protein TPA0909_30480 [Streptomyces albus]|nr:hypothetical protein TPA0909_30480 [Streptomyces albus]